MDQLFNISIGGNNITSKHDTSQISELVNRVYDTATVQVSGIDDIGLDSAVVINYGDKTFTGFVYAVSRVGRNSLRVECRTESAKLTEPYSPSESVYDDATTSHDLMALYSLTTGIPITISAFNIDFGGSYQRDGTMLSALTTIANVTGAEFYDNGNGGVVITPNIEVTTAGRAISDDDIFDYIPTSKSVFNKGIGFITVQNGGEDRADIVSLNKIYAEVDECTGAIFIFPNPIGELEYTNGMGTLTPIIQERKEDLTLLDEDVVHLDGAIFEILSVTLNGATTTEFNYVVGHDVIYFNSLQRGTLTVTYKASGFKGYTNISVTTIGRFISFDAYYLDQVMKFQGFLNPDCDSLASTDGDMTCIVPRDPNYVKGFDLYTIGGVPEFLFFNKNIRIYRDVVSVAENYVSVEDGMLEEVTGGTYICRVRYDLSTALGAKSSGIAIAYTISSDEYGWFFEFTSYFPNVVVSYEVVSTKHTIQFADIVGGEVTMVVRNDNTGETCEYDLSGINNDDLSAIPCVLDQWIPVNIAQELSVEVTAILGLSLPFTNPNNTAGSAIVDEFGIIKIWVFMDGDYVVNTASIKARTTVTLTVNVNG